MITVQHLQCLYKYIVLQIICLCPNLTRLPGSDSNPFIQHVKFKVEIELSLNQAKCKQNFKPELEFEPSSSIK